MPDGIGKAQISDTVALFLKDEPEQAADQVAGGKPIDSWYWDLPIRYVNTE
jgi:hypothetical protein